MPVIRMPDGKIIVQRTKKQSSSEGGTVPVPPPGNDLPKADSPESKTTFSPPPNIAPNEARSGSDDFYNGKTKKVGASKGAAAKEGDTEKTILNRPKRKNDVEEVEDHMVDPVVGWLVIIDGPGAGTFRKIGFGLNNIGRNDDQRIVLNFGDEQISRTNHASLSYDQKGKKFYIQHGDGSNLTYLNDVPVLQPTELVDKSILQMGETTLRFVAFCDDLFDWNE